MKLHILHENDAWTAPLRSALQKHAVPFEERSLADGAYDLQGVPPEGIFFSKMSASAHTRGRPFAAEYANALLFWLESRGRTVVNGSRALRLELSKAAQYAALHAAGIRIPRTHAVYGKEHVAEAAERIGYPVILKPNRGGKGIGVRLFHTPESLREYIAGPAYEAPVDGILLAQEYIRAPEPFVTRLEYIGGKLLYAVRVDASDGFERCPAEACALGTERRPPFEILDGFSHPIVAAHETFLRDVGIDVAGVEIIGDLGGEVFTYDVNVNTNYNPDAEARAGVSGTERLALYFKEMLG
jgi:glutathione synthase/RimK-type ligase-like ATP-grasp enzyme